MHTLTQYNIIVMTKYHATKPLYLFGVENVTNKYHDCIVISSLVCNLFLKLYPYFLSNFPKEGIFNPPIAKNTTN